MSLPRAEAGAACALSRFHFFGAVHLRRIFDICGSYVASYAAGPDELARAGITENETAIFLRRRNPEMPARDAEWLAAEGIVTLTTADAEFPNLLREIPDPPAILHLRGHLVPDAAGVAVVGTRCASAYGLEMSRAIAAGLSRAGLIVVSGLALGVDAAAHAAAGGRTWAFLGSGVNKSNVYPPSNRRLAEGIVEKGGALLSEFPPGVSGFKHIFPLRNRLIAGSSLATVVVEAREKSGSLITAKAALDYNREVFAVPHDARRPTGEGPNSLIRRGARLATSAEDILDGLGFLPANAGAKKVAAALPPEQEKILALLSREPAHIDDLARKMGLLVSDVGKRLQLLEIAGEVRNAGGGAWTRAF